MVLRKKRAKRDIEKDYPAKQFVQQRGFRNSPQNPTKEVL